MPAIFYGPPFRRRVSLRRHRRSIYSIAGTLAVVAALALMVEARSYVRHQGNSKPAQSLDDRANTGASDDSYFVIPVRLDVGYSVCLYSGGTIVAAATLPIVSPDSDMKRVAACADQNLALYAPAQDPSHLFVKTDTYRYLEVCLQLPNR